MKNINKDLINFINKTPNAYFCVDNLRKKLTENNFIELFEAKSHFYISEAEQQEAEMQILNKYFKVDGKSTKMRYISYLKSEFDTTKIDEMFQVALDTVEVITIQPE